MENQKTFNPHYGAGHSKKYQPQLIEELTISCDCDENVIKKHSDLYLMLRQKQIDSDAKMSILRDYINGMQIREPVDHNLTDEQLHQIVSFRDINTITDAYEYSQFLAKNQHKLRDGYKKLNELIPKQD